MKKQPFTVISQGPVVSIEEDFLGGHPMVRITPLESLATQAKQSYEAGSVERLWAVTTRIIGLAMMQETDPQPPPPTEPEAQPIRLAKIADDNGDYLTVRLAVDLIKVVLENENDWVVIQFDPKNAPHTVAALKALMSAIELDGGEVVR